MKHIAPHRFADAAAGRLDAATVAQIEAHAATCQRCAKARDRITAVREAFADIRGAVPDKVGWNAVDVGVAARTHWEVSTARNGARDGQRRAFAAQPSSVFASWRGWILPGAAAAAALVLILSSLADEPSWDRASATHLDRSQMLAAPVESGAANGGGDRVDLAPATAPTPIVALSVLRKGAVTVNGESFDFNRGLGQGDVLATSDGVLAVQLGPASGFVLGKHSRATLSRLDGAAIELVVDGVIELDLEPRAEGQRFELITGERRVSVRGTAFRVVHVGGALDVSCTHGRVVVADASAEVAVRGGNAVSLDPGQPVTSVRPRLLAADELEALTAMPIPVVPLWSSIDSMRGESVVLRAAASQKEALRVDGIELGEGATELRVLSGRHLVERSPNRGTWSAGEWVTVRAGGSVEIGGASAVAGQPGSRPENSSGSANSAIGSESAAGRAKRSLDLREAIDASRARACLRVVAKQGFVDGAFVELEVGVAADGAISHLNIVDTNLPMVTARCVRDVVDGVKLGRGPRASFVERVMF